MWKLGEISLGREKLVSGRGSSGGRERRQRLSTLFYAVECQRQRAADVKFVVQVEVIVVAASLVVAAVVVACLCCCCICCVSLVYDLIF